MASCRPDWDGILNAKIVPSQEAKEWTALERKYFPKKPKKYADVGAEIGSMTDKKQAAYGDSFGQSGKVLAILYPDGIKPEQYTDALAITRVIDKLFRLATKKDAFGESPWRDIAGYGLLGVGLE